ncbi:transglutaminase family protein [Heliobacterium chlorum]|uniref:Transglutaminase family protein n=1 Tax=Heliobacterium chlorum TaxID=2698 RepID=A0ABR7SZT5_HELCL|nr:transglutaminase family protein [Heliobacterium chlorum]MBC9782936.1 transglutaminase family protein [Heliobacterium chlorum]
MTRLRILHTTHYRYSQPVKDGVSKARLMPCEDGRQHLLNFELNTYPLAALWEDRDAFGNAFHTMWFPNPHAELIVEAKSLVETNDHASSERIPEVLERTSPVDVAQSHAEWLMETAYCRFLPDVRQMAEHFDFKKGGWEEILRLSDRLYRNFDYEENVTAVHSSVQEILTVGSGVCQDFAHLMAAILRVSGVPARYVSGYIPCDGSLRGSGASHAWVETWLPGQGWKGIDPTNNTAITPCYVKIAHGRDYRDIIPFKGVYRGSASQELQVTVDVQVVP